jgi:cobalt-precorrin-5B (C1)-methyltransferase
MGDFAGGLLKYLRTHPVPRLTIAGGFAKMAKLAQGALDLHSGRSQIDNLHFLSLPCAENLTSADRERIQTANTALEILGIMNEIGINVAADIAEAARRTAVSVLREAPVEVDVIVIDRTGNIIAHAG